MRSDVGTLKKRTIRGIFWAYTSAYSGKILVFVSTIILARLLLKEDFGVAGFALVVISILDVVSDLGIGPALIYHRDDPKANDTAFILNLLMGLALFSSTWLFAPLVGEFFNDTRSVPLTRVLAFTFPINSLCNIHASLLQKNLNFKRKFVPDLVKATSKGIISIILAWYGFGAWSLVLGHVGGTALAVIAYWWVIPWRPTFRFNLGIAKSMLFYGSNIVAVNSLGSLSNNLDYLIIGRFLGAEALGIYTLAFRLPELLVKQLCLVASTVIFPAYTKMRDDTVELSRYFLVTMSYVTMITVPIALGLAVVSRPLVLSLYTEKWEDAVPVMSAIAIYMLIRSLNFNIGDVYKAQGRPEILTKLSLVKVPILAALLWWAVVGPGTIVAVAWVQVVVAALMSIVSLILAARLLHTPLKNIVGVLQPALINGVIMAVAVLTVTARLSTMPPGVQLVVGVLTGGIAYCVILWYFQREFILHAGSSLRAALNRS